MTPRDVVALLAAALIVAGVALLSIPAAVIAAGVLLGVIFLADLEPRRRA